MCVYVKIHGVNGDEDDKDDDLDDDEDDSFSGKFPLKTYLYTRNPPKPIAC